MKFKLPEFVSQILQKFQEAKFEIYIIGGAVRDLLMDKSAKDWDFTTNATPDQILKVFPDGFYDNKFGTVGIADENKKIYEITTFRKEIGYSDRRHPDRVIWGETIEEDLSRRDFTINAIALKPSRITYPISRLTLVDPFNGQKDLKVKLVRTVGDAEKRFSEDALRLMRAVRIATQLSFTIEPKTFTAIQNNASLINQIAKERIRDELFKILKTDFPADGFTLLFTSGLLTQILPEIIKGYGIQQTKHHKYDVWTHSLLSLKHCPSKNPLVRFATFLHDVGKPVVARGTGEERTFYNHEVVGDSIARNIAQRLRFSKKEEERLILLIRWHQFSVDERQTDSAIRRFIRNVGKENLRDILDLRVGDRLGGGARETSWRLEKFKKRLEEVQKQPFSIQDLKVNGNDVMQILGIGSGPMIGKVLNQLFQEVVKDKNKNKREYLLKRIQEIGKTFS